MNEIFDREQTFKDLGLRNSVLRGAEERGYLHPTAIQAELIPSILSGKDVFGEARTGTGKTAAFGLPMLHMVDAGQPGEALILAPTRELAMQITRELQAVGEFTPVKIVAVFGGEPVKKQASRLKQHKPAIIVGTPGRVMDLHNRGLLPYDNLRFVVLDEVDRMLDIGFRDDIRQILRDVPDTRQTIFVSATISQEIESLARQFMRDPSKHSTTAESVTVDQVDQSHLFVNRWDKRRLLRHLLTHEEPALTLVFCATKNEVDRVTRYLKSRDIDAHAIHGNMYQGKRNRVMRRFRSGNLSVLIASDLASRGLDVEGVSHVINYDIPNDPDLYVHRIGRTARIGRDGIAWTFVTPEEGVLLTNIERFINREIPAKEYADFEPSDMPERMRQSQEEAATKMNEYRARVSRTIGEAVPPQQEADVERFPDGLVPVAPPKRRMKGRLRTRRGR